MSAHKHAPAPEKVAHVKAVAARMKKYRTILIASCRSLPSKQFNDIRKKLRGHADVTMMKKTAAVRAIEATGNVSLKEIEKHLTADIAFFFSDMEPFELSALLSENQIPSKARAGDIAPENIEIQPGPTDLVPGPAISELSGVGLKVAVKEGKLEIIRGAVVAKHGEAIKENVAAVLGKLGISPMKVGFLPIAAFDSHDGKVYVGITINKEKTLDDMRENIRKAIGFAVKVMYVNEQTVKYFLAKASMEEKAIQIIVNKNQGKNKQ
ncbi:MAG: 50S ribosomal protein L10 [Nanoarchaeota archaeon]|mgnify:FL=1